MSPRVSLLFPVEVIWREVDFRLLLAGMCAGPQNRVIIAQHDVLHEYVDSARGGVYLGKNVFTAAFPTGLERYQALRERGTSLVHLDEEGLVPDGQDHSSWRRGLARRLDSSCLQPGDRVCTWGAWQRDFYRSCAPVVAADIMATGHPRFDLCKPRYRDFMAADVANLRRRFGDFVLVNTSFGLANNAYGITEPFSTRIGYGAEPAVRDYFFRNWQHDRHLVTHFIGLIYRMGLEFPDRSFVIRPHPAEDRTLYDVVFRDSPNVHVVRDGTVGPWLLACGAMVHEHCTTGIEAALAGTPIVAYAPIADEQHDMYLSNLFGTKARTEDAAVAALRDALAGGRREFEPSEVTPLGHTLLANFDGDALEDVTAILADAQASQRERPNMFDERTLKRIINRRRLVDATKRPIRPMFAEKARNYKAARSAFSGFSREVIARKVAQVAQLIGKRLRHAVYGDTVIVVESAE